MAENSLHSHKTESERKNINSDIILQVLVIIFIMKISTANISTTTQETFEIVSTLCTLSYLPLKLHFWPCWG